MGLGKYWGQKGISMDQYGQMAETRDPERAYRKRRVGENASLEMYYLETQLKT